MAEHQRTIRPTSLDVEEMSDTELEKYDAFTPDDEYFTPPTTGPTTAAQSGQSAYSTNEYQPVTLTANNRARETVLPIFPPRSSLISMVQQPTTTAASTTVGRTNASEEVDFLLCNVPKYLLTTEQYQQRQMNAYIRPFELRQWDEIKKKNYHSFMATFHTNIYANLSKLWNIDIPVLDYNLDRMYQCATKHGLEFSLADLPVALEFFLQMDVDVFYLKTRSVRQGQRRMIIDKNGQQSFEGIFTIDHRSIKGRYGLTPCNEDNCLCCKRKSSFIQFVPTQIYSFLNQYKAVLNCPATCTTSNIVYALTCPCGEKDYVAHTNLSFVDVLLYHRRETARICREFLIGDINTELIQSKPKSDETKRNDENWLYQHAARCSAVMQMFLDRNPTYWCFVPVPKNETLRAGTYGHRLAPPSPQITTRRRTTTTTIITPIPPLQRRDDTAATRLANNIPSPAGDYVFTYDQFNQQKQFFQYGKDRDAINVHNFSSYNAAIVAVLPDDCSDTVKRFIESLFITHGECQLNKDGRLINQHFFHGYPARGHWFRGLAGRPSSPTTS